MITYWTSDGATPAFSIAPAIAIPPRAAPEKSLRPPSRRPTGVRAPATITDVRAVGSGMDSDLLGRRTLIGAEAAFDAARLTSGKRNEAHRRGHPRSGVRRHTRRGRRLLPTRGNGHGQRSVAPPTVGA